MKNKVGHFESALKHVPLARLLTRDSSSQQFPSEGMTGEGMTSVSVSYEVRRQLNTLRTMDGHRSVDDFLTDLIRAHKLAKMNGELENLRIQMKEVADVSAEHLVQRLNLAPFKV